jgi:hypothetical protein
MNKKIKLIIISAFVVASFPIVTPLAIAQDDDDGTENRTLPPGINCDMADPIHYYCPMPPSNQTCNVYNATPGLYDLIERPNC